MVYMNITSEFRELLREKEKLYPDAKRRKLSRREPPRPTGIDKEYLREACTILDHINTLTRMLASIRKPYLNVDARPSPLSRKGTRNIDLAGAESWAGIKQLTNEERDQIDLQARVILSRCADRVKEMEALEKKRAQLVSQNANPLNRFLPARLRQDDSNKASDFVAAHHAGITWYLNRRLTEASQAQKEMQEERVKRQLERTKTLGSGAAREAAGLGAVDHVFAQSQAARVTGGSWLGDAVATAIGATPSTSSSSTAPPVVDDYASTVSDDEYDDLELSSSQIQQFEAENASILRGVQDTLEAVQQAESRLQDISALQMELVTHLTQQTELTDQLYEDAISATETVEKGNVQLREARRRAKDSRIFVLVFLLGASFSLLFLHYY
ncbi:uncharacterized protein SCHCODRAFT_02747727 [Schizophyllum commune H4-8]|uniref:t-SNARE coiled-coil homology domain-containing protein n=1 Tax=Schizophyllum commune (strain H4-8 / FGSC 9210) TaxID=578458 RepID=D8PRG2_SCHCM|nr:uncharacterized protein SCHCODRAFT_02747727 [Schizophyllum commune H4-8]KAI5893789.1 hypothetical protein SCHCODRAFT_02747727 [Schizophyllum commune H4-8]